MTRYTTCTHSFTLDGVDLANAKAVYVTFTQDDTTVEKSLDDVRIEGQSITISLSQEETGQFSTGRLKTQVRVLLSDGQAIATPIQTLYCDDVLKDGVIEAPEEPDDPDNP